MTTGIYDDEFPGTTEGNSGGGVKGATVGRAEGGFGGVVMGKRFSCTRGARLGAFLSKNSGGAGLVPGAADLVICSTLGGNGGRVFIPAVVNLVICSTLGGNGGGDFKPELGNLAKPSKLGGNGGGSGSLKLNLRSSFFSLIMLHRFFRPGHYWTFASDAQIKCPGDSSGHRGSKRGPALSAHGLRDVAACHRSAGYR
jgi:hypothetical protein